MHCDIKFGAFMCNSENQGSLKSRLANLQQVCRKMINTLSLLVFATLTGCCVELACNWMQPQWPGQARGPHRLRGSLSHLPFLSYTNPIFLDLPSSFLSLHYPSLPLPFLPTLYSISPLLPLPFILFSSLALPHPHFRLPLLLILFSYNLLFFLSFPSLNCLPFPPFLPSSPSFIYYSFPFFPTLHKSTFPSILFPYLTYFTL